MCIRDSKYIALVHSMQELLPAGWVMKELAEALNLDRESLSIISTVWEDNNGALTLANSSLPRMTAWSKHIGFLRVRGSVSVGLPVGDLLHPQ
eukprot:2700305-Ditylum_brightwellii.AAC.1